MRTYFDLDLISEDWLRPEHVDKVKSAAPCDLLGIERDPLRPLTTEDVKTAYRRVVLFCHPDKGGSDALFQAVTTAHETVCADLAGQNRVDGRLWVAAPLRHAFLHLGLKWEPCTEGEMFDNTALSTALASRTEFTQEEFEAFGVTGLTPDHVVRAGSKCYRPVL